MRFDIKTAITLNMHYIKILETPLPNFEEIGSDLYITPSYIFFELTQMCNTSQKRMNFDTLAKFRNKFGGNRFRYSCSL